MHITPQGHQERRNVFCIHSNHGNPNTSFVLLQFSSKSRKPGNSIENHLNMLRIQGTQLCPHPACILTTHRACLSHTWDILPMNSRRGGMTVSEKNGVLASKRLALGYRTGFLQTQPQTLNLLNQTSTFPSYTMAFLPDGSKPVNFILQRKLSLLAVKHLSFEVTVLNILTLHLQDS